MSNDVDHQLRHPNVPRPASAWSEAQTLHVAAAYSNPCRWRTRRELFNDFRRHLAPAANVRLYVGELAYGDRPHEVTDGSHPLDVQLRTSHELWHKENILNRVIQTFPPDWKYGAYCDGDFHFTRQDWALEAIHQLQHFDFVQLFSTYSDLGPNHLPGQTHLGFAYANAHRLDNFGKSIRAFGDVRTETGGKSRLRRRQSRLLPGSSLKPSFGSEPQGRRQVSAASSGYGGIGSPGGCWAFRRSALEAVGGLLDICILGSGDHHMAVGLAGRDVPHPDMMQGGSVYRLAIRSWQERAAGLSRNIGYVQGHAIHHYHGPKASRGYGWRPRVLRAHDFDPYRDLFRDAQGIYQLTPHKPRLRDDIRAYFRSRNEDAS
jgi:hypothetical protein